MKKTLMIITGILTIIFGIIAMCIPFRTFLALGWIFGALLLINGFELVFSGFSSPKSVFRIILGFLLLMCGSVILFNGAQRLLTDLMLAYFAGGAAIVYGIGMIISGICAMKQSKGYAIFSIIFGVLAIVIGIAAVMHPVITMISIGYIISASMIIQGINMIILSGGESAGSEAEAPASEK